MHFSIGREPVTSIYHGDDTLVTQQKGGILKRWHIANAGYVLDTNDNMDHTGFCRFAIDDDEWIFYPKNDNEICVSKLNEDDNQCVTILNPNGILEERKELPITRLGYLMCMKPIKFSNQLYVLAGYESGTFLTWDLRMNSVINIAQFEECPIAFDFCSESNRGIYGNATDKLGIFGYQRNEMKLIGRGDICIKNAGINCIRIRKDQKIFSAGGVDGRVRVFSWKSLRPLTVLTDHRAAVNDITYSCGKVDLWKSQIMATTGNDGQISLWNLYNN